MGCKVIAIYTLVVGALMIILLGIYTLFHDLAAPSTQKVMDQGLTSVGTLAGVSDAFLYAMLFILIVVTIAEASRRGR